jgi:hypothetical protein
VDTEGGSTFFASVGKLEPGYRCSYIIGENGRDVVSMRRDDVAEPGGGMPCILLTTIPALII